MHDLPYKPELESVESAWGFKETRKSQLRLSIIISLFIIIAFFSAYMLFWEKPYAFQRILSTVMAVFGIAISIWLRNLLNADFYLKTDTEGIYAKSLRNEKFISWDDADVDVNPEGSLSGGVYTIKSDDSSIKVTDDEDDFYIVASIWQHLNKRGKAGNIQLSEEALSLWKPVPDNLPAEIEWINTNPPEYKSLMTIAVIIFIVFGGMAILGWSSTGFRLSKLGLVITTLINAITIGYVFFIKPELIIAKCANLTGNTLHTEIYKKSLDIQLAQVKRAFWYGMDLRIVDQNGSLVSIPFIYSNTQTVQLFLAIIRQLRETNPQVFISLPDRLLKAANGVPVEF